VLLTLPGAALLAWLPARGRGWAEQAAIAFGLSLAFVSLTALAGWWIGAPFTGFAIAVILCLALIALAAAVLHRRPLHFSLRWSDAAALGLFALLVAYRLYQARELALPAWVDSIHHALLVRIFIDTGGLPSSLAPWIAVPFYYHFGFHAAAAVVSVFSSLAPDVLLLAFGQFLNAGIGLAVYRLSMSVRRDGRAALVAMALAGFVSEMPAFYLSWGRYTLLTGLILLALAMAEAIECARMDSRWPAAARLALLTAGTLLAHYLAGVLLAVFLSILALTLVANPRMRRRIWVVGIAALAGALLAGPWLVRMIGFAAPGIAPTLNLSGAGATGSTAQADWDYFLRLMSPWRNAVFLALGLAGALALAVRNPRIRPLAVWGVLLAALAVPWGFRLAPFRPDHLAIVLFLPAAVLAAFAIIRWMDWMRRRWPRWRANSVVVGLVVASCTYGIWDMRDIVNPVTVLADSADRAALSWIREHTPTDARFLVNVTYWQAGLYRGVDGGWWILPATGRQTVLPPAIYGMGDPDLLAAITKTAQAVSGLQTCSPDFWRVVREENVGYLYLHSGAGAMQPERFIACPGVRLVYREETVFIFELGKQESP
jgi:hypothetical protein